MADPWSEGLLRAELDAINGVSLVAEQEHQVCGYAFFRTCPPESELLRLAVAEASKRRGVGRALLAHALAYLSGLGYTTCFLEVRSSNTAARRLYDAAGFLQVGTRKKYYDHPVEDALQLCASLPVRNGGEL